MSRIHDVGGMHGFGPVTVEPEQTPPFDHLWEMRVFALMKVVIDRRVCTLDEVRHAIERMDPSDYLGASYYERWVAGLEAVLVSKGLVVPGDFEEL